MMIIFHGGSGKKRKECTFPTQPKKRHIIRKGYMKTMKILNLIPTEQSYRIF